MIRAAGQAVGQARALGLLVQAREAQRVDLDVLGQAGHLDLQRLLQRGQLIALLLRGPPLAPPLGRAAQVEGGEPAQARRGGTARLLDD